MLCYKIKYKHNFGNFSCQKKYSNLRINGYIPVYKTISCFSGPKQRIAFLAFVKDTPTLSDSVIKFDDVETNIGNQYNLTNGVFTAPKNGLYVLSSMIMAYGDAKV